MTSDAKIGLLLGLVFIFIIAFVINGLPRFRSAINNTEPTTNMVSVGDDSLGIGARERRIQETIDLNNMDNEPAEEQPAPANSSGGTNFEMPQFVDDYTTDGSGFGSSAQWTPSLPDQFDNIEQQDNVRFRLPLTPNPFRTEQSAYPARPSSSSSEVQTYRRTEPAAPALQDVRPQPAQAELVKPAQARIYIVQDGDNLSSIAKKCYGEQEGNRLVNINRIFEANRDILNSADSIDVGQKIIIPPLPGSSVDRNRTDDIFSSPQFERVESIGRPNTETGNWYIVKKDDNLWDIAAEQLGKGSRYKEIIELNSDKVSENSTLPIGMRLRLPAQ